MSVGTWLLLLKAFGMKVFRLHTTRKRIEKKYGFRIPLPAFTPFYKLPICTLRSSLQLHLYAKSWYLSLEVRLS